MEASKDKLIAELRDEIKKLKAIIADLTARLSKNSSNSSKPPSSAIVSPPKTSDKNLKKIKRKQGAPKGHKRNLRVNFTPDQIDEIHTAILSQCPNCGGRLHTTNKPDKILRQIELVDRPFRIVEYRQPHYCCENHEKDYRAQLPVGTFPGLFGSKLKALTAWIKGAGHLSFKTLQ